MLILIFNTHGHAQDYVDNITITLYVPNSGNHIGDRLEFLYRNLLCGINALDTL